MTVKIITTHKAINSIQD